MIGWSPLTTRLLTEGGPFAWNVIDSPLENDVPDLALKLNAELTATGLLSQLQRARTTGDVQFEELLTVLRQNSLTQNLLPDSLGLLPPSLKSDSVAISAKSNRGDLNLFIDRETRQNPAFGRRHRFLHKLIQSVEAIVFDKLSRVIQFSPEHTSVQLAEYPVGAGYARHCDRPKSASIHNSIERIITVVYYLTPSDWSAEDDGGSLRLHLTKNCNTDNKKIAPSAHPSDVEDIVPYSNRMVIFRSDYVEHQVLPCHRRPRRAITIWLYGRLLGPNDSEMQNSRNQSGTIHKELATLLPILEISSPGKCASNQGSPKQPREGLLMRDATQLPPPLPIREDPSCDFSSKSIFVSIAAYRDSETGPTIRNLMATASNPNRITIGLMLQIDTLNPDHCYDKYQVLDQLPREESWWPSQVKCLTMDARHSTGPCLARSLCQQGLYRGEDYVLQIDSHMRFRKHWDVYLIQQLEAICISEKNTKIMLSTYPIGYELPDRIPNETGATILLPWKFDDNGMLRQRGRLVRSCSCNNETSSKPILNHLYAAGFNFAHGAVIQDCPYPPLHHLFFGEELVMALRLYVAGYNIYVPAEAVCYHLWNRSHRPQPLEAYWNKENAETIQQDRTKAISVVQDMLQGKFLLDEKISNVDGRSVENFALAIGVDFDAKKVFPSNFKIGIPKLFMKSNRSWISAELDS